MSSNLSVPVTIDSAVPQGVAPLIALSNTLCANLNAQFLNGNAESFYRNAGNLDSGRAALARLPTSATANRFLKVGAANTNPIYAEVTKSDVGLGNVENTALSSWAGSGNITTIGTLSSGSVPWARLTNIPSTFAPSAHTHDAADVVSGRFNVARLGDETPNDTKFLRGDGKWMVPPAGGISKQILDVYDAMSNWPNDQATQFKVTHSLNSTDLIVQLWVGSSNNQQLFLPTLTFIGVLSIYIVSATEIEITLNDTIENLLSVWVGAKMCVINVA
jgi:hypothetical protein